MDLVAIKKQAAATEHEHDLQPVTNEEGAIEYWTCTMHPSVKMKEPGKCPICAMDLVPVRKQSGGRGRGAHDRVRGGGSCEVDVHGRSAAAADDRSPH